MSNKNKLVGLTKYFVIIFKSLLPWVLRFITCLDKLYFMGLGDQILFFSAGLGVFNGFILVIYLLFFAKPKKWSTILLGFLIMMICLRIGKSLFHVFTDLDRVYRQIGLSACMMIGPFLWVYLRAFLREKDEFNKWDAVHILMPFMGISIYGIFRPYEHNDALWNQWVIYIIYWVWIFYVVISYYYLHPIIIKAFKGEASIRSYWAILVYGCVAILCLAYNLVIFNFPYLAGPILFSLILYFLVGVLINHKNRKQILYGEPIKYKKQKMDHQEAEQLLFKLEHLMKEKQAYLNPKLKLGEIASLIDSTPHGLSQVINDRLQMTFNQYVNKYRVQAACKMLQENEEFTIEGIGLEVGFNSRSSFYSAFKSIMNQTPSQYKSKMMPS